MKSVNEWMEIIPPDTKIPADESAMYIMCQQYIKKLSEVDNFRAFAAHIHFYR